MRDAQRLIDTIVTKSYTKIKSFKQQPLMGLAVVFGFLFVSGVVASIFLVSSSGLESGSRAGAGDGLKGEYYDNTDFTLLKQTRTDPTINFNWKSGSPHSSIEKDTFSVRWSGFVQSLYSETYTFTVETQDIFTLWIDDKVITSNSQELKKKESFTGAISLTASQFHAIRIDYQENTQNANIQLLWQSASQSSQVVPQSQLHTVTSNLGTPLPPPPPPIPSSSPTF